jgi:hypothetical protein
MTLRRTFVMAYPSLESASEEYLNPGRTYFTSLKTIGGIVKRTRRLHPDTEVVRIERYDGYRLVSITDITVGDTP